MVFANFQRPPQEREAHFQKSGDSPNIRFSFTWSKYLPFDSGETKLSAIFGRSVTIAITTIHNCSLISAHLADINIRNFVRIPPPTGPALRRKRCGHSGCCDRRDSVRTASEKSEFRGGGCGEHSSRQAEFKTRQFVNFIGQIRIAIPTN
jgi:hypothetical protein